MTRSTTGRRGHRTALKSALIGAAATIIAATIVGAFGRSSPPAVTATIDCPAPHTVRIAARE